MITLRRVIFTMALLLFTLAGVLAQDVRTHIPERAKPLLPTVYSEAQRFLPEIDTPGYFGALIEHESCISLKHSKCWAPNSELRTSREQGVGLGQITRAWRDGRLRFDTLDNLRRKYPTHLGELSWDNIKDRADLQIRAIALLTMENWNKLPDTMDPIERLAMTDAAYNGGFSDLAKERRACGLAADCDPDKWFGNVENYCVKSRAVLYGRRSACDINRDHVRDVIKVRMPKYERYMRERSPDDG